VTSIRTCSDGRTLLGRGDDEPSLMYVKLDCGAVRGARSVGNVPLSVRLSADLGPMTLARVPKNSEHFRMMMSTFRARRSKCTLNATRKLTEQRSTK
jgi:hypothetical protein